MKNIPIEILKEKLNQLSKAERPVKINDCTVVVDHEKFISSHLKAIATASKKEGLTNKEKAYKLYCISPAYNRLLSYYYNRAGI